MQLDFEIDKLTHSLEDMLTGEILATEVAPLDKDQIDQSLQTATGRRSALGTENGDKNNSGN